jgi:hypothetical protein
MKALSQRTGLDRSAVKSCCFFFMREGEATVRRQGWRVVSEQRLNKAGRSRASICGPTLTANGASGRFNLSAPQDLIADGPSGKRSISRSDHLVILDPELRETGWGLGPETRIERIHPF